MCTPVAPCTPLCLLSASASAACLYPLQVARCTASLTSRITRVSFFSPPPYILTSSFTPNPNANPNLSPQLFDPTLALVSPPLSHPLPHSQPTITLANLSLAAPAPAPETGTSSPLQSPGDSNHGGISQLFGRRSRRASAETYLSGTTHPPSPTSSYPTPASLTLTPLTHTLVSFAPQPSLTLQQRLLCGAFTQTRCRVPEP